jgi:hypothetical protein
MITLGQHLVLHKIPIRSVPSEVVLHNKSIHNRSIHKRYQFALYHKLPYQVVLHYYIINRYTSTNLQLVEYQANFITMLQYLINKQLTTQPNRVTFIIRTTTILIYK